MQLTRALLLGPGTESVRTRGLLGSSGMSSTDENARNCAGKRAWRLARRAAGPAAENRGVRVERVDMRAMLCTESAAGARSLAVLCSNRILRRVSRWHSSRSRAFPCSDSSPLPSPGIYSRSLRLQLGSCCRALARSMSVGFALDR